jgi:mannose-6-phosphate isomerase
VARRFSNALPFLFKVLAAAAPLSIQAHPDRQQAREGFERENKGGVPLDAPHRNYRDRNHKPELLCALTPFTALKGFRRPKDILSLFDLVGAVDSLDGAPALRRGLEEPAALKAFFHAFMNMASRPKERLLARVLSGGKSQASANPAFAWVLKLHAAWPDDMGVLSPLLLNLVTLAPGQAVHVAAGEPHAYLEGAGVELMANSDNVLRGGLTSKHMDLPELLKVLSFTCRGVNVLRPLGPETGERPYPRVSEEFQLSVLSPPAAQGYISPAARSVEILICVEGGARIIDPGLGEEIPLPKGTAVLVPAAVAQYVLKGQATIYKAFVPLS